MGWFNVRSTGRSGAFRSVPLFPVVNKETDCVDKVSNGLIITERSLRGSGVVIIMRLMRIEIVWNGSDVGTGMGK